MKWRVVLAVGIVSALAIGMYLMLQPERWRYKMTVEIQTPEGVRTGSAIREVTYEPGGGGWLAQARPQWHLRGEAVAVDLPGGRTLYALLTGNDRDVNYGGRIADMAYSDDGRIQGSPGPVQLYPTAPNRPLLRNGDPLPMLVMFADPTNPRSSERIDPRNIGRTLGAGYTLKSIILGITDEPVTKGIDKRLPWIQRAERFQYSGIAYSEVYPIPSEALRKGVK